MALDRHVELGRFEINDHTSDFWCMLFSDEIGDVLVDGSAHDLFPVLTGGVNEVLRVEHVVDLRAVGSCPGIHLWLLIATRSRHHHCLWNGLGSWLHLHDLTRHHWLLEHALPLDLRHLHHIPVALILVPPVSVLVPPLVLLLLGLNGTVDRLLELRTISCLSTPRIVLVALEPKLAHNQSE